MATDAEATNGQEAEPKRRRKAARPPRTRKDPGRELKCTIGTKTRYRLGLAATHLQRSIGSIVDEALKPYLAPYEVRTPADPGDEEIDNL